MAEHLLSGKSSVVNCLERLNPDMVKRARKEEIGEVQKHMVYKRFPLANARMSQGSNPSEQDGLMLTRIFLCTLSTDQDKLHTNSRLL